MKKAILVAVIGAMTLGVNAGDWSKAPVAKAPIEECYDLGGSISVGYDTDYIFYGVRFARDSVWADVNYTFDNLAVPINIGVWYLNGINSPALYDELDIYASADLGTFAGFDVSVGYVHYFFPETAPPVNSIGEVGLDVSRSLGFVDLAAETNFLIDVGWYHQIGIEKSFGITDSISLVVGTGVGYSDGYYGPSGWNAYYVTASLPIELNCRTTLTPYITYNGAPDGFVADTIGPQIPGGGADILYGGISLSVSF